MLPKDILKHARKFSPDEIESAIKKAIENVGKTLMGRIPDNIDWLRLQQNVRQQVVNYTWWSGTPYTATTDMGSTTITIQQPPLSGGTSQLGYTNYTS